MARIDCNTSHRIAGMGRFALSLGILAALLLATQSAEARPRPAGSGSSFQANKTFGLGIMLPSPTGLSGKLYLSPDTAFDFGVGVLDLAGPDAFHVHADFLWHPLSLVEAEPFWLPMYFGLGARVADYDRRDGDGDDDINVGLRVPIGLAMDFNNVPLDVFFELALVLDLVGYDGVDAHFHGALGVRYYFF
ncbi:hypothetical protein [Haliangium ochraceum]|uniref:Outer membrane protein beta-barrel domain-containing protein n=1 Tax=Haliangium ochraceum (strain DSM 14365 / JCM 11303 / SMP-2) TaxID=502025 RepID=D0LWL2_HALO1|nr:hypothetical protein [Haliangium ochraceum]ACY17662.1 hypothetical protein Hoch_5174 [Haliangium ochraceum DSM 14365]